VTPRARRGIVEPEPGRGTAKQIQDTRVYLVTGKRRNGDDLVVDHDRATRQPRARRRDAEREYFHDEC
jgi:hypothetical protein